MEWSDEIKTAYVVEVLKGDNELDYESGGDENTAYLIVEREDRELIQQVYDEVNELNLDDVEEIRQIERDSWRDAL